MECYFKEIYLEGNDVLLVRILELLYDGLKLWNGFEVISVLLELYYNKAENKPLNTEITEEEFLRCQKIKTHYIQRLISMLEHLKETQKSDKIKELQERNIDNSTTIIKQKPVLSGIITHPRGKEIVEGIKVQYKNIKGKQLKLLLLALQQLDLMPTERIAKQFHQCCEAEFDWDIASYNAMNDYKYDKERDIRYKQGIDTQEIEKKKKYINSLIK